MLASSLRIALLAVAFAGCTRTPYTRPQPVHFRPTASQEATYDALVKRANMLGYALEGADRVEGIFLVHSQVIGHRPSSRPTNLFVVEVADAEVRVSAVGRNVAADGRMDPRLAAELERFGRALQNAAVTIPVSIPAAPDAYRVQPPRSYETVPPSAAPPRSYTEPRE